jgi:hypothetical protein
LFWWHVLVDISDITGLFIAGIADALLLTLTLLSRLWERWGSRLLIILGIVFLFVVGTGL